MQVWPTFGATKKKGMASKLSSITLPKMQQTRSGKTPQLSVCVHSLLWFLSKEETRQWVRSNALSFLQAVLPEEPGLLHRGGDGGGDWQRMRGDWRRAYEDAMCKRITGLRDVKTQRKMWQRESESRSGEKTEVLGVGKGGQGVSWAKCVREQHNSAPQGWVQQTI